MKFLSGLLLKLTAWLKGKPSSSGDFPADTPLHSDEPIARYVVNSRKVSTQQKKLKAEAFIPHPYKEMSVFRTKDLDHEKTRLIGQSEFADKLPEPKRLLAWGVFQKSTLDHERVGLAIAAREPNDTSHPRHRDVVGWPSADDSKIAKAKQKEVALELSERTTLVMAVTNIGNPEEPNA